LVFSDKFLLAVGLLILMTNWVNTNGENLLFGSVEKALHVKASALGIVSGEAEDTFIRDQTTKFYGDLFFWVNAIALLLQSLAASRVLRYAGFAALLLCLPVVALVSYTLMALHPRLAVIRISKIAENSTDYSLNNTAKQVLWLPTAADVKYRAKAAIDTLFVRVGDGLAAATAFGLLAALTKASTHLLSQGAATFFTSWQPYSMAVVAVAGAIVQQSAFQAAPLPASLPVMDATEPTVAVLIGVFAFGEALGTSMLALTGEAAGIVALIAGIVLLDRSPVVLALQEGMPAARSEPHVGGSGAPVLAE